MKRVFLIFLSLFFISTPAFSATIVYPKKQEVVINSPCTFFIGNEDPERVLKINSQRVDIYKTGAFKHAVDLNYGENIFTVDNGIEVQTYKITRQKSPVLTYDTEDFAKLTSDENPQFEALVKKEAKKGKLIITVDPGHGGKESGAVGCLCEKEKDINLAIAQRLKHQLELAGYKVLLTREDDSYKCLRERVEFANKNNSHIFISIHANALPDSRAKSKVNGVEVYYLYPQAQYLAANILKSLGSETNLNERGVYQRNLAVVRNSKSISVLVETGYIIDPEDESKLINPDFQEQIAKAILDGLENYLYGISK